MISGPPELLIFPCNGNGLEALDCLGNAYRFAGFVDDSPDKQGVDSHGHRVMGRERIEQLPHACLLAVPGGPRTFLSRKSVIAGLRVADGRFATAIHPTARISALASIGFNVLIMAGVVVTSDARIGNHVCILPNSVVHHGATIGDWTLVGANVTIAGNVTIGENCYVASGSSLINDLRIGDEAMIGLGSNVIRDVAPRSIVAGNPARPLP